MTSIVKSRFYILFISLILSGCFASRNTIFEQLDTSAGNGIDSLCRKTDPYQSLYIEKIKATIDLDGEIYDAKINLFYIPDSIIFLSAVNTGFEIVRVAITADSTILINRIDKVVYIYKNSQFGYKPPVDFKELEYLLDKERICKELIKSGSDEDGRVLDFSVQDIDKRITYKSNSLKISKFEFFHKKTNEYIVGEILHGDSLLILSNYLIENVEIMAVGGNIVYNKDLSINLSFNKNKYTIINY